jgi:hypothetical protein
MSLENPKEQPNHTYSTTAINLALGGGVIDGHGLRGSNGGRGEQPGGGGSQGLGRDDGLELLLSTFLEAGSSTAMGLAAVSTVVAARHGELSLALAAAMELARRNGEGLEERGRKRRWW